MLKLLKYDLKRDLFVWIGGLAAMVLLLVVIEVGGRYVMDIMATGRLVLSTITYATAIGIVVVLACGSFRKNIGSMSRRLIPVSSWVYLVAATLYAGIGSLVLLLLAAIHFLYYSQIGVWEELKQLDSVDINKMSGMIFNEGILAVPLLVLWAVAILFSALFFAIAVTESLRIKARSLVGVLLFFAIGTCMSWVENSFFGGRGTQAIPALRIEGQSSVGLTIHNVTGGWAVFVFEFIVTVLLVWLTIRLIDRRVHIK